MDSFFSCDLSIFFPMASLIDAYVGLILFSGCLPSADVVSVIGFYYSRWGDSLSAITWCMFYLCSGTVCCSSSFFFFYFIWYLFAPWWVDSLAWALWFGREEGTWSWPDCTGGRLNVSISFFVPVWLSPPFWSFFPASGEI